MGLPRSTTSGTLGAPDSSGFVLQHKGGQVFRISRIAMSFVLLASAASASQSPDEQEAWLLEQSYWKYGQ